MIGQHTIFMGDYHVAFTLPLTDPGHCDTCQERATIRAKLREHITTALDGHEAVDLRTPELRYIATASLTPTGVLGVYDRLAGETIEHWTDPDAPKGRRYTRI